jgi:hypothetical protein
LMYIRYDNVCVISLKFAFDTDKLFQQENDCYHSIRIDKLFF